MLQTLAVAAGRLRERTRVQLEATFHGTEIEYGVTDGLPPAFQTLDALFHGLSQDDCNE